MKDKASLRARMIHAGGTAAVLGGNLWKKEKTRIFVSCIIRALIGFIVSQAVVFDYYSPFGLGFAAIGGGGLISICGAIGVSLGYLSLWKMADSLKYIAGTIMVFTAMRAFRGTSLAGKKLFPTVAVMLSTFCIGFVFVVGKGFLYIDIVLFFAEIILAGAGAFFYNQIFSGNREYTKESSTIMSVSLLVLLGILLLPLSGVKLIAGISPGRLLAILLIMLSAVSGGMGAGSATGVTLGMIFDIGGGGGFYSMSYGISGLLSGAVSPAGKLPAIIAFILANAAAVLVDGMTGIKTFALYEVFAASVIFTLIPQKRLPELDFLNIGIKKLQNSSTGEKYIRKRLSSISRAFRELGEVIRTSLDREKLRDKTDISQVFDRTAEKTCRRCALKGLCWGRDCLNTYNIMNDMTLILNENGKLTASDLPDYFSSRCLKLDMFVSSVNEEMRAFQQFKQYKRRIERSHDIVCGQYNEISSIIKKLADEATADMTVDRSATSKLRKWLRMEEVEAECAVWHGKKNRLNIEIEGQDIEGLLKKGLPAVMRELLGEKFNEPEYQKGPDFDSIHMRQNEPITAVIATATHKRGGTSANGDCGTYFKTDDGELCVLLSDGMGSGKSAAYESGIVIRLMEKFLRAGIEPMSALEILNSALAMKNEDNAEFATLDMLKISLFNGDGTILKCGAAPTYTKTGREVNRIYSKSLPIGALKMKISESEKKIKLGECEYVLMISDGVSDGTDDGWLKDMVSGFNGENPKELALSVAEQAVSKNGEKDDITAIVVKLS
jgi:stage II sporulation protein E